MNRLRDNLGIIDHPREAGELADEVPDTGGVYFVTVRRAAPSSTLSALWLVLGAGLIVKGVFLRTGLWRLVCAVLGYPRYVSRSLARNARLSKHSLTSAPFLTRRHLTAAC